MRLQHITRHLKLRSAGTHRRTPEAWAQMELDLADAHATIKALRARADQLDAADQLTGRLVQQRDDLATERDALLDAYDELFARHQAATTVSVPAPMDDQPTIRLTPYDPDATEELTVTTLWNGLGLRPLPSQAAA